jgi:hypothetical protein
MGLTLRQGGETMPAAVFRNEPVTRGAFGAE